jgi:uncharacterized protein (DUF2062 family)
MMFKISMASMKRKAAGWLRQGISPRRLAFTLALGFAIGCLPVVGVTSALCGLVALGLRLNLPAIQAANWAAAPLQLVLILPFVRLGERLTGYSSSHAFHAGALLHSSPSVILAQVGGMIGQAMLAWLLIAIPMVALMTAMLTMLLHRIPAVARAKSGDRAKKSASSS